MNKPLVYYLILVFLLATPPCMCGQHFAMLHFTTEDGLPSNTIYQVYRDADGYIWVATDKGIARYNGIKFETYTTFNGLADNEVFLFQEDYYGRLWIGTYNGELCYYKNDSFYTAANDPLLKLPFKSSHVYNIFLEKDSSIIIRFNNQQKKLDIRNGKPTIMDFTRLGDAVTKQLTFVKKISPNRYRFICGDSILEIDTQYHICKVDTLKQKFYKRVTSAQNQHYLYTDSAIYTVDFKWIKNYPPDFIKASSIYQIYFKDNNVFYTTGNGLYINDSILVLSGKKVSSITHDIAGNYWVGTLNDGLYIIKQDLFRSNVYNNVYTGKANYAYTDGKHLFLTTSGNKLLKVDHDKVSCIMNNKDKELKDYEETETVNSIITEDLHYFYFNNGQITIIKNLLSHNTQTIHASFNKSGIKQLLQVKNDLYIKQYNGIEKINIPRSNRKNISITPISSHNNAAIFGMAKDADDNVWYSTIDHLYEIRGNKTILPYGLENITFKHFDFAGKYIVGYTHNNQLLICSNTNGNILIDTVPSQKCIWDKFYDLGSNRILISTNNLYRLLTLYPGNTIKPFSILTLEDPFIPVRAEAICSDTANCYFFKNGSIISTSIENLLKKANPPKLFFAHLITSKRIYSIKNGMSIPFAESKDIIITFSTLSSGAKNISYQYSVSRNGYDDWKNILGDINLVHPGFGTYTIKVRAKSLSSKYSVPIAFTFRILPPFWAQSWFIILFLFFLAAIIIAIFRSRLSYVLSKKEEKHQADIRFLKSEYKALNALMNPHFIFNTLNNVQDLVNKNDKHAAIEYLRIFFDLIRQNMQNISKELIPLQKEIDLVFNYLLLEKLRFEDFLNYQVDIDEDLDLSEIMIPPLLIQPLVENSIKHGILPLQSDNGIIHINVYEQNKCIWIEVRDNGVGLSNTHKKKDVRHQSHGLENIRKRIAQLNAIQNKEIIFSISEMNNNSEHWTIAMIRIPLSE